MKAFYATGAALLLSSLCAADAVRAQDWTYGSPSLLPLPAVGSAPCANPSYPVANTAAYEYGARLWPNARPAASPLTVARGNVYAPDPQPATNNYYAPDGQQETAPSPSDAPAPNHGHVPPAGNGYSSDCHGQGGAIGLGNDYAEAMQAPWGCGAPAAGCGCPCLWFAGAYGLIMTRDADNHYYFSYDTADERDQRMDARQFGWGGGFEARFGRYFHCGTCALEAVYWGLYPGAEEGYVYDTDVVGSLDGILNWNSLDYNGASADTWVNNAYVHRVARDFDVHNVELNVLGFPFGAAHDPCCSPRVQMNWLLGARYLHFSDEMQFAADTWDSQILGDPEEIYYDIDVDNHLYGFQLGGQCEYSLTRRIRLNTTATLGVFGNHIEHRSRIGGAAGDAVINNGPNSGLAFNISSDKDDVAFLGEARVGLTCQFTRCWSGTLGYRAVAVTGVALPTNQIYPDLRGIQDVAVVDSNGSLILHGGYAGVEFNY